MSTIAGATTKFADGRTLLLEPIHNRDGDLIGGLVVIQLRPGQQRRTMQMREYRTMHDALHAYQAMVRRVNTGGEP